MRICTIKTIAADLTLFVDNSCFQDEKVDYAGYAAVQLNSMLRLSQPYKHEWLISCALHNLTAACKIATGKRLNVYSNLLVPCAMSALITESREASIEQMEHQ